MMTFAFENNFYTIKFNHYLKTAPMPRLSAKQMKQFTDIEANGKYKIGDHLIQPGAFGIRGLNHHAVYIGDGKIIHYYNNPHEHKLAGVVRLDNVGLLEKAAARVRATVKVRIHHIPPTPAPTSTGTGSRIQLPALLQTRSRQQIKDLCLSRMHERKYNLFFNNCQHFANWCVSGVSFSEQLLTQQVPPVPSLL